MTIETKYSIDQTVYKLYENKVQPFVVKEIQTSTHDSNRIPAIKYKLRDLEQFWIPEEHLFPTKEALIESL